MQRGVELSCMKILACLHYICDSYILFFHPGCLHSELSNRCALVVGEGLKTNTEHTYIICHALRFHTYFFI